MVSAQWLADRPKRIKQKAALMLQQHKNDKVRAVRTAEGYRNSAVQRERRRLETEYRYWSDVIDAINGN